MMVYFSFFYSIGPFKSLTFLQSALLEYFLNPPVPIEEGYVSYLISFSSFANWSYFTLTANKVSNVTRLISISFSFLYIEI